jgi:hypothetical protein
MHAPCNETPLLAASPAANDHSTGHALYQGGTVLVILLFLISFWSC